MTGLIFWHNVDSIISHIKNGQHHIKDNFPEALIYSITKFYIVIKCQNTEKSLQPI